MTVGAVVLSRQPHNRDRLAVLCRRLLGGLCRLQPPSTPAMRLDRMAGSLPGGLAMAWRWGGWGPSGPGGAVSCCCCFPTGRLPLAALATGRLGMRVRVRRHVVQQAVMPGPGPGQASLTTRGDRQRLEQAWSWIYGLCQASALCCDADVRRLGGGALPTGRRRERQQLKWSVRRRPAAVLLPPSVRLVGTPGTGGFRRPCRPGVRDQLCPDPGGDLPGRPNTGCTTSTGSSAAPWSTGCSPPCSAAVYAGVILVLGARSGSAHSRPAGRWPAPPWPLRRCSSRPAVDPADRGSTLQPAPLRHHQDDRGVQRPPAPPGRPGHRDFRAAGGGRPDHGADPGLAVASTRPTRVFEHTPQ